MRCFRRVVRRRGGLKCEAVPFFERRKIFGEFLASGADFQDVTLKDGKRIVQELGERPVDILAEGRVHGVLEDVSEFSGDFGEQRKAVRRGGPAQRVRRDIEAFEVIAMQLLLQEHTGILSEELQLVGGLLQKEFDGFAARRAHDRSSTIAGSRRCAESTEGLRYRMQSPSTMA